MIGVKCTRSVTTMPPNQIGFRCVLCLSAVPLTECRLLHCCERVYSLAFLPSVLSFLQTTAFAMDVWTSGLNRIASDHSGGYDNCTVLRVANLHVNPTWVVCLSKPLCWTKIRNTKLGWRTRSRSKPTRPANLFKR